MRIRRGAALPTAVALCTFLLIISFVVTSIILEISMLNKLTNIETDRNLLFLQAHNLFIEHNGDISTLEDATYTWHTYEGENNIKALAAYKNYSNEIKFYSIYDFDNEKTLAFQSNVTYVTTNGEGVLMLGGIVPIVEG